MAGLEFYQTMMGHAFYERDVPQIVKALNRIATVLERLAVLLPPAPPAEGGSKDGKTDEVRGGDHQSHPPRGGRSDEGVDR